MTGIRIERDIAVELPDGISLSADVYRPDDDEPHPTLFQHTAYNKSNWISVFGVINPMRAVGAGFAVVVVDARGRFASGGDEPFQPFFDDGASAVAVIEWIAAQPWSTGAVGMYGASNNGVGQWQAAKIGTPALKAIAPHFTASEYDEGWVYRGGAFQLGFNTWWTIANLAPDMLARAKRSGAETSGASAFLAAAQLEPDSVFQRTAAGRLGPVDGYVPYYADWLRHGRGDPFWEPVSLRGSWEAIDLPILHIAGWYNVHLDGNLANYTAMRNGGPPEVRDRQHLIIGPWTQWLPALGEACGPEMRYPTALMDMEGLQLSWFAEQLAGGPPADLPSARVFVMGAAEWRTYDEWPPTQSTPTEFFLDSEGAANGSAGGGVLSTSTPASAASDRFVHDPSDPVPTVGGATMLVNFTVSAGQRDQRAVEARDDVLVYSTLPLEKALTVVGHVSAVLWVTSSEPTADFTAKLVDVYPDGRAMLLTDGIVRVGEVTEAMVPGEPMRLEIDMLATANVFQAGHAVRLEIAGSNFPKFDLHARRTKPGVIAETVGRRITQAVFHDAEHRSALVLPVLASPHSAS